MCTELLRLRAVNRAAVLLAAHLCEPWIHHTHTLTFRQALPCFGGLLSWCHGWNLTRSQHIYFIRTVVKPKHGTNKTNEEFCLCLHRGHQTWAAAAQQWVRSLSFLSFRLGFAGVWWIDPVQSLWHAIFSFFLFVSTNKWLKSWCRTSLIFRHVKLCW